MKIVELKSSNVKRLKAVQVIPKADDPLVVVGGNNGQGKSSLMDSLLYALAGGRNIPALPVREGEEEAVIEVDLGDYKVTRKIKADGKTTLTLRQGKGAKVASPQRFLDDLVGSISFDPEEFGRMQPREQRDLLVTLANVDTDEIDEEIGGLQFQLGEARSELKVLEGQTLPEVEADPNWDLVDIAETQTKLNVISEIEDDLKTVESDIRMADEDINKATIEIERLKSVIAVAEGRKEKLVVRQTGLHQQLNGSEGAQELRNRLATAAQQNEQILAARRVADHETLVDEVKGRVNEIDSHLKDRKATRVSMIEQADMPIDGLSFDDKQVLFDGIPFDQLAASEQLRISMAMAMSMNPELRVIRIMNGALLDGASLEIVRQVAGENDYQVWVEVVGDRADAQVIIEDGGVR